MPLRYSPEVMIIPFFFVQALGILLAIISLVHISQSGGRLAGRLYAYMAVFLTLPPIGLIAGWILWRAIEKTGPFVLPGAAPGPARLDHHSPVARRVLRWVIVASLLLIGCIAIRWGLTEFLVLLTVSLLAFEGVPWVMRQIRSSREVVQEERESDKPARPRIHGLAISAFILVMIGAAFIAISFFTGESGLLLAGGICLVMGLLQSLGAMFTIRKSPARLRGSGLALAAFLIALFTGVSSFVLLSAQSPGLQMRNAQFDGMPSRKYKALLEVSPPKEWIQGEQGVWRIKGPAAADAGPLSSEELEETGRLVGQAGYDKNAARRLVALTVLRPRDRATREPITIRLAEMAPDFTPRWHSTTRRASGMASVSKGRIIVQILCTDPMKGQELVDRLYRFYEEELKRIDTEVPAD